MTNQNDVSKQAIQFSDKYNIVIKMFHNADPLKRYVWGP